MIPDDEREAAYRLADEIAEEIADEDRRREDNPEDFLAKLKTISFGSGTHDTKGRKA